MDNQQSVIKITDQQSMIHLGSLDSFDITKGGKKAAQNILAYLDSGNPQKLKNAVKIYEAIIPNENFGGEYTALEWLCRYFLAPNDAKVDLLAQPLSRGFYELLAADDFDNLRMYLKYKYHIVEYGPGDNTEIKRKMRFLEDFILFNNPDRERWESTRENLKKCDLREGMRVADVGSGPGYYSFKFADIVGPSGKVYAIETNPRHLEFLNHVVAENNITNVDVVTSSFDGIGLNPDIKVDVVFICSLYHNVYAAFTDAERDSFVGSIRNALVDGGRLIIVDNDLVTGQNLPYHGPYINKEMIISQLWHYGFALHDTFQFSPQRYVLIFEKADIPNAPKTAPAVKANEVYVSSTASLVRYRIIGTSTSGYTKRGKHWGNLLYQGLVQKDNTLVQTAIDGFDTLWPQERIGDDYTAFIWFGKYFLGDENTRRHMTSDALAEYYADYFCANDFERLKQYLFYKFHLEHPEDPNASDSTNFEYDGKDFPIPTLNQWNEFLVFDNPNRVAWEKTDEMCRFFDIREGERVADIGCGGGFFTWFFSKAVGPKGVVYATEINKDALSYLEDFVSKYKIENIKPLVTKMNDAGLPKNSVDTLFMCSMYHAVYITDIEFVKDAFIESIRKALRPGGRLIIVDNNVTEPGVTSYYGPGISPELIIVQLHYYGFRLKSRLELIPQRFVLVFEEVEGYVAPPRGGKDENGRDRNGKFFGRLKKGRRPQHPQPQEG